MNKAAIFALGMLGAAEARMGEGSCPTGVTYMDNFEPARFAGKWFQVESDSVHRWASESSCVTQEYAMNADGNLDLYFRGNYNGGYRGINGTLYDCETGTCQATMGSRTDRRWPFEFFATDYENYHISYHCYERDGQFSEFLSVNSRQAGLSPRLNDLIRATVAERLPWYVEYLDSDAVKVTPQGGVGMANCVYNWNLNHD